MQNRAARAAQKVKSQGGKHCGAASQNSAAERFVNRSIHNELQGARVCRAHSLPNSIKDDDRIVDRITSDR